MAGLSLTGTMSAQPVDGRLPAVEARDDMVTRLAPTDGERAADCVGEWMTSWVGVTLL